MIVFWMESEGVGDWIGVGDWTGVGVDKTLRLELVVVVSQRCPDPAVSCL